MRKTWDPAYYAWKTASHLSGKILLEPNTNLKLMSFKIPSLPGSWGMSVEG